jgi:hypothetical protein
MSYHNSPTKNGTSTRYRDQVVRERIIRRKQEKKSAKEKYRGRNFEFRNGILYFAGTRDRVPGSIMIQKPKRVQEHRGRM